MPHELYLLKFLDPLQASLLKRDTMSGNSKVNLDVLLFLSFCLFACLLHILYLSIPLTVSSLVTNILFLYMTNSVSYCKDYERTNNPMRSADSSICHTSC
jgi:hypothetical protein